MAVGNPPEFHDDFDPREPTDEKSGANYIEMTIVRQDECAKLGFPV